MTKINHRVPPEQRKRRIRENKGMSVEDQLDAIWEILEDLVDEQREPIRKMRNVKRRIEDVERNID